MSEFSTLSFTDSDGALFTLAQINHLMKVEFARSRRYRLPLTVVVFTVDRLVDLSRNFGYKARELVLERFHAILRRETRSCDFTGRFKDDRVLLLLPHTAPGGAQVLVGRIRRALAGQEFQFEGKAFRVTASAGLCHLGDRKTLFFDSLRETAEEAANRAAKTGDAVVELDSIEAAKGPSPEPSLRPETRHSD
jgi:diguanylate cyclase (GGDEF)-like protein